MIRKLEAQEESTEVNRRRLPQDPVSEILQKWPSAWGTTRFRLPERNYHSRLLPGPHLEDDPPPKRVLLSSLLLRLRIR